MNDNFGRSNAVKGRTDRDAAEMRKVAMKWAYLQNNGMEPVGGIQTVRNKSLEPPPRQFTYFY